MRIIFTYLELPQLRRWSTYCKSQDTLLSTYEKDVSEDLLHEILHLKNIQKIVFNSERSPI